MGRFHKKFQVINVCEFRQINKIKIGKCKSLKAISSDNVFVSYRKLNNSTLTCIEINKWIYNTFWYSVVFAFDIFCCLKYKHHIFQKFGNANTEH